MAATILLRDNNSPAILQLFHEAAAMVEGLRGDFFDKGVDDGVYTKGVSPDGALVIYAEKRCDLVNGDFEGHLIQAMVSDVPDVLPGHLLAITVDAHQQLHDRHRQLMESNPSYAYRYQEAEFRTKGWVSR